MVQRLIIRTCNVEYINAQLRYIFLTKNIMTCPTKCTQLKNKLCNCQLNSTNQLNQGICL